MALECARICVSVVIMVSLALTFPMFSIFLVMMNVSLSMVSAFMLAIMS